LKVEKAMAELRIAGDQLELHLTAVEKLESVHGDIRLPLSVVQSIEVIDDAHGPAGITAGAKVGTRIPGVIEVATIHGLTKRSLPRFITTRRAVSWSRCKARRGMSGSSDVPIPSRSQPRSPAR
jgi:hypothetical protein